MNPLPLHRGVIRIVVVGTSDRALTAVTQLSFIKCDLNNCFVGTQMVKLLFLLYQYYDIS